MKSEPDYLALDFNDIEVLPLLDRREFLKSLGAGIFVFVSLGELLIASEAGSTDYRIRPQDPADFNAFLRIAEDGQVTCFLGKVEMGQGIYTSMAQLLAEELDVAVESVHMVLSDTEQCPYDMGTWGSMSIRHLGPTLRKAGAEARAVLLTLAARELGVKVPKLKTENGFVMVASDPNRKLSFGSLAKGQKIQRVVGADAVIKDAAKHQVVGTSITHTDANAKVTGKAIYAGDVRLPGMLYARILRPPSHASKLESVRTSGAEKIEGAKVIHEGDFVAVLHPTPDGAEAALRRIRAEYETPDASVNHETIFDALLANAPSERKLDNGGDLAVGEKAAEHLVEASFKDGYVAHAPMETHTAVASVKSDSATVWASTQNPFGVRSSVARILELDVSKVRVIAPFVGGGFGGKSRNLQAEEAVRLSKIAGVPIHLEWTRAEEFFYDSFRPAAVVNIRSGVTAEGRISSWDFKVYHAGTRGAQHFYDIPHHSTISLGSSRRGGSSPHPFATGAWRAPANNTNTFARESQIDMMAAAVKMDPFEFRMRNLKDKRMRAVLQGAADAFGWKAAGQSDYRGQGIACGIDAGTYVALMAQVKVNPETGKVRVERVVCAQDMGLVVNPRGARMQAEGCVTMGLGYALSEDVRFTGGEVHDTNFDTYILPRFSDVPEIETVFVDTGIEQAHGGGEPAIITVGGMIANAIYDAVGARLLQMPMTPERVREAMAKA